MKTRPAVLLSLFVRSFAGLLLLLMALAARPAHAGLQLSFSVIHDCYGNDYTIAPNLYLNENGGDSTPVTYDQIYSPQTNFTGGVGNNSLNDRQSYPDFNSCLQAATNGTWLLILNVGATNQHSYTFHVSTTLSSNDLSVAGVVYPLDGDTNVEPLPNFEWYGPATADTLEVFVNGGPSNLFQIADPAVTVTNTTLPPALAAGSYGFYLNYAKNASNTFVATTPLDSSNQPPPNWSSTAEMDTGNQSYFTVVIPPNLTNSAPMGGHTNIAEYSFNTNGDPFVLGVDDSGNGNNLYYAVWGPAFTYSTNAEVGAGAVQFVGTSAFYSADPTYSAWTNTLAGSFSVSFWLQTTNTTGSDTDDPGFSDQYLVYANDNNSTGPAVALTGSKLAFATTDPNDTVDTLHSQSDVTTGHYVQVVVTRDQNSGTKSIYLNGQLDSTDVGSTNLLVGESDFYFCGAIGFGGYTGLLDELQLYAGVLSPTDVSNLYANPGTIISNTGNLDLAYALNATNLDWTTGGDAPWFPETATNYDGVEAAQSGVLQDSQSSLLQTTVTGPGTLTFYWQTSANDDSFDLEFDIDGNYMDDIWYQSAWTQDSFPISSGTHILTWNANTYEDTGSSTNDTGWVDLVTFTPTPAPSPVRLLNPAIVGTNFQFQFVSVTGYTNIVQYSTNLAQTNWTYYSTIAGDGTTKTVMIPTNGAKLKFFRIYSQ